MNDKLLIKLGRYVINAVPVLYICAMVGFCYSVQSMINTTIRENASLTKRLAASDLKKSELQRQLAVNQISQQPPEVVIISPNGSKVQPM
ncbi:hypothetical protein [Kluyvera chengduensis]|uniref:hypothetical protein n=1 Tax=Kluyvera sp. 142359 TaxID=3375726 RepID=UPI003773D766